MSWTGKFSVQVGKEPHGGEVFLCGDFEAVRGERQAAELDTLELWFLVLLEADSMPVQSGCTAALPCEFVLDYLPASPLGVRDECAAVGRCCQGGVELLVGFVATDSQFVLDTSERLAAEGDGTESLEGSDGQAEKSCGSPGRSSVTGPSSMRCPSGW
jgi:hypothetical protein